MLAAEEARVDALALRCPACRRGALRLPPAVPLRCPECGVAYPVEDGIVDLLPADPRRWSLPRWAMEAEPIVRIYDRRLWRRRGLLRVALGVSFEHEEAVLLDAAEVGPGDTVLDLACGPGIYTRSLAARASGGQVIALDLSRPMLREVARLALVNVVPVHGTGLDLPLPSAACNVVNCAAALHLFPDVPRVLAEVARVLKPGGRFTVATMLRWDGFPSELAAAVRRRVVGMDSFTPAELTGRLTDAGLRDVRVHHARRAWLVMSARKPRRED